jgi:hypothetical protein
MAWQRRGGFASLIERLRAEHHYLHEIKWSRISAHSAAFYEDLIEEFFLAPWLSFYCVLVEKAVVKKALHGGDFDVARRKHLTMLLTNKDQGLH